MPAFNDWFPTSVHGSPVVNVMSFGAFGDNSAHTMTSLGYANLTAAQVDYPSATAMGDYADWCAITEAIKAAFTEDGVSHSSAGWLNRPLFFPAGLYLVNKPIVFNSIQGGWIYGAGNQTYIRTETATSPNNICFACNGVGFTRFENLSFQATGTDSIAFDLNWDNGAASTVATRGDTFINCSFAATGGTGCGIARANDFLPAGGHMCSEVTFIACVANGSKYGWRISNFNALNFTFTGCGGTDNTEACIQVDAGGDITVQNGSFAGNVKDIIISAGGAVLTGVRTESKFFVQNHGQVFIAGCMQNYEGNDNVFLYNPTGTAFISCSYSSMGRLVGAGPITLDSCTFNTTLAAVTAVASGTGGVIRLTHADSAAYGPPHNIEYFLDGDEVEVQGITSLAGGAAATNGVWRIVKVDHNHVELVGSTYVADTYTLTSAYIGPGPRYHLTDNIVSVGTASRMKVAAVPSRAPTETKTDDFTLLWADSGKVFNNDGATGAVTFTLPFGNTYGWADVQSTRYTFVVMAAQTLTILAAADDPGALAEPNRIIKTGGTDGTNISCATIGSSVEVFLADGAADPLQLTAPYRWMVRSETGTWTLAGDPDA